MTSKKSQNSNNPFLRGRDLFDFVENKKMSLKGYTLIEGFPDLGLAGTIGTKYMVEKLDFEEFGYIDSGLFMPIIRVQNGVPMHPVRLYVDKKHKTIVALAEQIIPDNIAGHFAKAIIEWIKEKGITTVISTSGIRVPNGEDVYAFASNEKSKKIIKKHDLKLINNGITSGVTALMMLYLKDNKIDAFCLMGNAKNNADYHAAAQIVKAFCKLIGVCIDIKPLLKEAKKIEEAVNEHLKTLELQKKQNINNGKNNTPMYV
jgi:uncharacterized protein